MIENLTVAELSSWLASQPENTTETPYEINLTDVTNTNITYIKSYLQANPTKYVNLSPTYITNYSMSLSYLFENCTTLIESPRFATPTFGLHPSMYAAFRGCTNLKYGYLISGTQDASRAFQGCTSLISFPGGITSYLRDISYFCDGCTSLQSMPYLSDTVTNMEGAFRDCTSLTSITNIPSSIRNIAYAFKGCTGITSAPDIPYGITSLESTFEGCTALEECGSIANSVTDFTKTFKGCTSMTSFPDISSNDSIGLMESTFEGCTGITTFSFPLSVRNVKNCFKGVTSLETVNNVPSGITNAESCFEGCTSLETINLFSIPLNTLKNNVNFKDMFKGCTSLTSIGSAVEESDDWHIFYLGITRYTSVFDLHGWVYDKEGNSTQVSYYNFTNDNLVLFQLTDELWFPPNLMLDADVKAVIEKVVAKKVSYFNKEVVDPEKKTFIMYADDPEEVHTNLKLGGGITVYPTQEELEEDLPNLQDGDIVGTYGDDNTNYNDAPLGSVMSYLGNTDPSDGKWLVCDGRDTTGTAIELETHYPSLYMFLGGTNVLPEIFDHSRPSAWETITISTNSASPTTMQYDGVIYVQASRSGSQVGHNVKVFINGTEYKSSLDTSATNYWTAFMELPVKKGDSVYTTYTGTLDKMLGCFYKHHNIIKAVSSVDTYNMPSSEIAQVEQYFNNGLQNAESYSTTETWTGGYWFDGKKIYRKAGKINGTVSDTAILDATLTQSYVDTVCNSFCQITTASNNIVIGGAYNGDTGSRLGLQIGANGLQKLTGITNAKNLGWWIEYTKTTD